MDSLFYASAGVAILATFMVVTRRNAVHALLYLILSLLAVAGVFLSLGAHFAAALEIIIYAGAIMVLFVFVIMMVNPGTQGGEEESKLLSPKTWVGPSILAAVLLLELVYALAFGGRQISGAMEVTPKQVGIALFSQYVLGVELASMLLLAGLVGAYHLGRRTRSTGGDKT